MEGLSANVSRTIQKTIKNGRCSTLPICEGSAGWKQEKVIKLEG